MSTPATVVLLHVAAVFAVWGARPRRSVTGRSRSPVARGTTPVSTGVGGGGRTPFFVIGVAGLAGAVSWWPWGLLVVAPAEAGRRARRRSARRGERAAFRDAVEVLVVLLELALSGGASLRRSLDDVLPWVPAPLAAPLGGLLGRVDAGATLSDEIDALAGVVPELRGLAEVIGRTERYGAPALDGLRRLGAEAAADSRRRLEQAARKVPLRLLLPLVGAVLPAFVMLSVVPMVVVALAAVRGVPG